MAREYLETEILPPPSTCYGFLLALVGETDRRAHLGVRVTAGLFNNPDKSVVLRTIWRLKKRQLGAPDNSRPDYQQLLTNVQLVMWVDSMDEEGPPLEDRVRDVVVHRQYGSVQRFGGLSLGESTHLVDEVSPCSVADGEVCRTFLLDDRGRITLPVWVDHVGSAGTVFAVGNLLNLTRPPDRHRLPRIGPI